MKESEIIKKLKDLKEFGADPDWKKSNRELLLSQIQAQAKPAKASIGKNVWYGFRATLPTGFKNFMFKPVGAFSLIIIMIFGASIFSVSASRGSVPGDVLYRVKLTSEKIHAGLTVDDQKKSDLYMDFAGERLNEVDKLKNEPQKEDQKENQKENMKVAIGEFTKQMGTVKDQLEKVKAKPKSAEDIVNVAKNVDERVEALSEKINQKQQELKEEYDLVKELKEAEDIADETSDAAIDVIIEKHVSGEVETPVEELTQKIEKKIQRAEEEIVETRQEFDDLQDSVEENIVEQETKEMATESVEEVTDVATTDTGVDGEAESALDIEQVEDRPQEAQDLINEAKELLAIGDISTAFEKIIEGKRISREVEQQIIEDIESQQIIDAEIEINAQSATELEPEREMAEPENLTN